MPWKVALAACKLSTNQQYYTFLKRKKGNQIEMFNIEGRTEQECYDKAVRALKERGWTND